LSDDQAPRASPQDLPARLAYEERLKALLDTAVDGIYIHDLDGAIVEFSQSFADMLGYSREEIRTLNVADIDAVKTASQLKAAFRDEALDGKAKIIETRHRRKDGSTFDVEISVKAVALEGRTHIYTASRDISERVRMRKLLDEERQRLRDFATCAADSFSELDETLTFTYVWEGFDEVSRSAALARLGVSLPDSFARDTLNPSAHKAEHLETLRARKPFRDFEYAIPGKDGQVEWLSVSGLPVFNEKGGFAGYRIVSSIITARKRSELELEQSQRLLQELVDISPYGVAVFDENRDSVIMNANYGRILDLPNDLLARKPYRMIDQLGFCYDRGDFGYETPKEDLIKGFLRDMQTGESLHATRRVSNGRWIERRGALLSRGHMVATYFDVTSYKTIESELRAAKERLEAAAAAGIIGLWAVDAASGEIFWDGVQRQLYGVPEKDFEITAEAFLRTIHPEDQPPVRALFQQAFAGAGNPPLEFRILRPDGALRYLRGLSQTIFGANGRPERVVGVTYDVTEQRETLRALEQAKAEAEAASNAKSEFLANVSHELRTPLNAIVGMTQLLARSSLDSEQANYVRKLDSAGQNMLVMISDVLDLSKIETRQLDLNETPFSLEEVIAGVADSLAVSAVNKGLALRVEPLPEGLPEVMGDAVRIGQVLSNLVGNAIKFTSRGEVTVSMRALDRSEDSVRLRIAVRDTGIGIASEHRDKLFAPFVQAEGATHSKFGGTGLGLAISKRLIDLMGGEIGVESEPGKGSEFWFVVSLRASASGTRATVPAVESGEKPLAGVRVLVVDDTETNREIAIKLLSLEGAICESAENGRLAIERLRGKPEDFDIILMDVQMPEMDGLEAVRAIRHDLLLADLPVIAITAGAMPSQREAALAAGMDGFVAKPFRLAALIAALSPWIAETSAVEARRRGA